MVVYFSYFSYVCVTLILTNITPNEVIKSLICWTNITLNTNHLNALTGIPVPPGIFFGSDSGGLWQLITVSVGQSVQYPRYRIRISSPIDRDRCGSLSPIACGSRRNIPTLARPRSHSSRTVRIPNRRPIL